MSMLSRLRNKPAAEDLAPVEFFIADMQLDLESTTNVVDYSIKKTLKALSRKYQRKYGHLKHPVTGEQVKIRFVVPDPKKPQIQCRLIAESEEMRAWLKGKGIVIGEVITENEKAAA